MPDPRHVTVISHGPNCLDGLTCAVVLTRNFSDREIRTIFAGNNDIDDELLHYSPRDPAGEELWVTDISWRSRETDTHLNSLIERGLHFFWIDHHKTAIDRRGEGRLDVSFTDHVLSDRYAASRLVYEYLQERAKRRGAPKPELDRLENLVLAADDVDRWVLEVEGSRELALTVRAMHQDEAFHALLSLGPDLAYTPELERARERMEAELAKSLALAEQTRFVLAVPERGLTVVTAECEGFTGEVADRWNRRLRAQETVYALYDHRTHGISMRRSPDCTVDLSRLAGGFGGGGHAAAAGCNIEAPSVDRVVEIARRVAAALKRGADR